MDSSTYLGVRVTKDGGATLDIKKSTELAYASFNRLTKNISRKTKATLFKTLVFSVLLYGCEIWKMTKERKRNKISSRPSASQESFTSDGSSICPTRKCWRWQVQTQAVRR